MEARLFIPYKSIFPLLWEDWNKRADFAWKSAFWNTVFWSWVIAQLISGKLYQKVEGGYLYVKLSEVNLPKRLTYIQKSTHYCNANESGLLKVPRIIFPKRGGAIAINKKELSKI